MRIALTSEQLMQFPIHDSELRVFFVSRDGEGLMATIDIGIVDDSYDPGYSYPRKDGVCRLLFLNCHLIQSDFKGSWTGRDTLDAMVELTKSGLLEDVGRWSSITTATRHYQITAHSGSQIDIVSESVIITAP